MGSRLDLQQARPNLVDFDFMPQSMAALILDYLESHSDVTFVDLEDDIPGFSGELDLKCPVNRKTMFWRGLSASALHALHDLEMQGKIRFGDTSPRIYQSKGRVIHLPVDEWESTTLHWTPVLVELNAAGRWGRESELQAAGALVQQ